MSALTDALAWFDERGPKGLYPAPYIEALAAAARRVAEAPEWTICEVHNSRILDWSVCETSARMASQMQYLAPCRMVRKLLVDPPKENQ